MGVAEEAQEVTDIPTADLRFKNQDMVDQSDVALLADIARNGIRDPIDVYFDGRHHRVIRGNQRLSCARALGMQTVRCTVHKGGCL